MGSGDRRLGGCKRSLWAEDERMTLPKTWRVRITESAFWLLRCDAVLAGVLLLLAVVAMVLLSFFLFFVFSLFSLFFLYLQLVS